MKPKYSTNRFNELYDTVRRAALYNITDSVLSISFELVDKSKFHIRIYVLKTEYLNEKKYLEIFHQNLKKNLGKKFEVVFEVIETDHNADFRDLQILSSSFYLLKNIQE